WDERRGCMPVVYPNSRAWGRSRNRSRFPSSQPRGTAMRPAVLLSLGLLAGACGPAAPEPAPPASVHAAPSPRPVGAREQVPLPDVAPTLARFESTDWPTVTSAAAELRARADLVPVMLELLAHDERAPSKTPPISSTPAPSSSMATASSSPTIS